MDPAHSRVSGIYSSVNWGLEMSQAFVTLWKQEVAVHLKNTGPALRMCGHDRHWARAADSTKLAGLPSSSSRVSSDACQQPSDLHLWPNHWSLTQNQHTPQNPPLLAITIFCLQLFRTKTRSHFQLPPHATVTVGSSQEHSP